MSKRTREVDYIDVLILLRVAVVVMNILMLDIKSQAGSMDIQNKMAQ